jgi:hypothetical protein
MNNSLPNWFRLTNEFIAPIVVGSLKLLEDGSAALAVKTRNRTKTIRALKLQRPRSLSRLSAGHFPDGVSRSRAIPAQMDSTAFKPVAI